MNTRSLMSFLSLRTKNEGSAFPSYPQREIEMVAEAYEAEFIKLFPIVHMHLRNGETSECSGL
jgi:thymidylate synthase (FAD)